MKLTPIRVRQLVELAFVLEPLLNKNDCTTRYKDLPNKPLTDFVIAGVNVGSAIEEYADSVINGDNKQIFSHYPEAMAISNEYKGNKYINQGLLEFMFVFIRTRLLYSESVEGVLNNVVKSLKETDKKDVLDNLKGFRVAIKTSTNEYKKSHAKDNYDYFKKANNIYELFEMVLEKFPDKTRSGHQTAQQYLKGFPIVARYVNEISEKKGLIRSIENSFNTMHKENLKIKIGILADLAAVAIFLHLSFQKPSYVVK